MCPDNLIWRNRNIQTHDCSQHESSMSALNRLHHPSLTWAAVPHEKSITSCYLKRSAKTTNLKKHKVDVATLQKNK